MVDVVNGLLVRDGSVLMALRATSRRNYPGTWSFPGGHVEGSETLLGALRRELLEEIGVKPVSESYLAKITDDAGGSSSHTTFHLFRISAWTGKPANLGDEHEQLHWFSFEEARKVPNLALDAYHGVFDKLCRGVE